MGGPAVNPSRNFKLKNPSGESLDVHIEGSSDSQECILFVHGFGTDKHETNGEFDYIAQHLTDEYRIIRFDFSGYGKSEGNEVDVTYSKHAKDIETLIRWIDENVSPTYLHIIAQSMGCFITALLSPSLISKSVFISIPNPKTSDLINLFVKRVESKGGKFSMTENTIYPRSTGKSQLIGPSFWQEIRELDPLVLISDYSKKTDLLIIHGLQDEIVGDQGFNSYGEIGGLKYIEIDGDHSFKKASDRQVLINHIKQHLRE